MAKGKIVDLGLVAKIHPSGMCETDKGGRIKMDSKEKKPYVFVPKKSSKVNNED